MKTTNPLELTRRVLRLVTVLNGLYGGGVLLLLLASVIAPDFLFRALGFGEAGDGRAVMGARALMVVGVTGAVVTHVILQQLRAMVDTVREGDPFVARNAQRLQTVAWWALVGEVLHLLVGVLARFAFADGQTFDLDWSFSITPWIAVLLLFVLARVFEQGTRMREDLEGTV